MYIVFDTYLTKCVPIHLFYLETRNKIETHSSFPFLILENLSNYFKYGSSLLTNTDMNDVPVSIWK